MRKSLVFNAQLCECLDYVKSRGCLWPDVGYCYRSVGCTVEMNAGQCPLSCHVVHDTGTVGIGDTDLKKTAVSIQACSDSAVAVEPGGSPPNTRAKASLYISGTTVVPCLRFTIDVL